MRTIIAISGKQRAGKDTLAAILLRLLSCPVNPPFQRVGLADALKVEWAKKTHPVPASPDVELPSDKDIIRWVNHLKESLPDVRRSIIEYSDAKKKRLRNPTIWVDRALETKGCLVIPDVRYKCEVERLYTEALFPENGLATRVLLVRVECSREERLRRAIAAGGTLSNEDDPSETELDDFADWDVVASNERPGELYAYAYDIVAMLGGRLTPPED